MPQSPATPVKAGKQAVYASPKSAMPSMEKLTAKVKQASLNEPSPASTYGETIGSSVSTPATPPEVAAVLKNVMSGVQDLVTAIENLSTSPTKNRDGDYSSPSNAPASSSKSQGATKARLIATADSSPASDRERAIRDPNWRAAQSSFVHRSAKEAEDGDDVFTSSGKIHEMPVQGSEAPGYGSPFNPRGDRAGEPISNDNAQALLPPSACVFVANLTQTQSDDQLEHHVSNAFSQYGMCWVKIRRDLNGMPFAFVQYETVDDAQRAITQGRGMLISGRPCRTEVAKVNRSLYLSRVTGGSISEAEARNVLARYGDIQKVWHCTPTENEIFRLPEGIWVMYAFFQDCRDAQAGFRDHPHYRLEQPPMADDFRARLRSRQNQSVSPLRLRQSPARFLASPMRRAATDLCSIFVGNLPPNITQEQLFHIFGMHGTIQNIEIIRKPSANIFGVNAFAFIEYLNAENAAAAVQASPRVYGNMRLRVERKESTDPSIRPSGFAPTNGSPRGPYLADPHDQMAMLYQRGVYAGMTQAAQAQAMPPPVWAPFPYYQSYDPAQFATFNIPTPPASDTAAGTHSHGNDYTHQAMGNFQFTQPAEYVQYPQQQAHTTYQWPPATSSTDDIVKSPVTVPQDSH